MLLSRVAESVYWSGRYLERAEATARMVKTHTELFVDLPKAAGLGWSPLLAITGTGEAFVQQQGGVATEDAVVRFLTADLDNVGSIRASVASARDNVRVSRVIFPESAWQVVNELHHFVNDNSLEAVTRRTRLAWMDSVVRHCQLLAGLLDGVMSHDEGYSFLEIGRYIERADMTSRVLQVQSEILMTAPDSANSPYADVTWMGVLQSLSARQMYRRAVCGGVSGPDALRFLLRDPQFPRSVEHCLTGIARSLLELPRCQEPMAGCADVQARLESVAVDDLAVTDLLEYVEELQVGIAELHLRLAETYFAHGQVPSPESHPSSSGEILDRGAGEEVAASPRTASHLLNR
jgi:uncharacterized alpha-E superfamily protein